MSYRYLFERYFLQSDGEPDPHWQEPELIRDTWRLAYGEPGLYGRRRSLNQIIACMRRGGARVVYRRRLTGQFTTITYPDLQKWMWECL